MNITCPTGGMNVLVTGPSPGVISVCGGLSLQDGEGITLTTIRVRVLAGSVSPPLPSADPKQPGDVDTTTTSLQWTAQNVPVPSSSPSGVPITVIAWAKAGTAAWGPPQSVWCNAGGQHAVSCVE